MVNVNKNGCKFYTKKVTFKDNGVLVTQYTNNSSEFESLINRFKHLSDITIEDVSPTTEQVSRLEVVNGLDLSMVEYWNAEITNFVMYGFIDPETNSILTEIASTYTVESKEYIIAKLSQEVASHRYEREVGGVEYNGKIATTDRESQSTVASSMMSFISGTLTSIDYKFKNGWETFDNTTFPLFVKVVGDHVSNCFAAEKIVSNRLETMLLEELTAVDDNGDKIIDTKTLFDTELEALKA